MSEPHDPPASPPTPGPATPPAPAPAPSYTSPPPTPPAPAVTRDPPSQRDYERMLAEIRAEAAAHRVEARTAREEAQAARAAAEQATRDADSRVAAAEESGRQRAAVFQARTIEEALGKAAVLEGMSDLDLLPLINRDGITCDDDGNVTGAAEAVAAYKATKPAYFRAADPGVTPPPSRTTGPRTPPPAPLPGPTPPDNVRTLSGPEYEAAKRRGLTALRGVRA